MQRNIHMHKLFRRKRRKKPEKRSEIQRDERENIHIYIFTIIFKIRIGIQFHSFSYKSYFEKKCFFCSSFNSLTNVVRNEIHTNQQYSVLFFFS